MRPVQDLQRRSGITTVVGRLTAEDERMLEEEGKRMEVGYTLARDLAKELGVATSALSRWLMRGAAGARVFRVHDLGNPRRALAVLTEDLDTIKAAWKADRAPIEVTK